ncbi:MAG TPA: CotH kinase family protein [Saprospiraceae bacterium]|nr:CotH kinase family protein [Saprospiraceae bacterium]
MKIRTFYLLLSSLGWSVATAQNFYDINTVQEIKISFYQSNWQFLLDSLKNAPGEPYLLVPTVEINGQTFDSVGVKYKGYSSYDPGNAKNPLHIELNHVKKGQNYLGVKDIKLSNVFADPTFVREILSYEILRKYMNEPFANYAKIWLDGEYWGVYVNVESVNKPFLRKHFHTDGNNPFFKCNPIDVVGTNGHSDLKYEEDHPDSLYYYPRYDIKSDYGWAELLGLMDTLTNFPNKVDHVIDVDRALWMLAFNNVFVNLDSYTGVFAQNYYLYQDKNDRWLPVVWDLNMSFGGFNNLDGSALLNTQQMKQLDPLAHIDNDFRPLIKSLLENPVYKRMYLAHMRTILQENFANTTLYRPRALELQGIIATAVLTDDKKFYSNAEFVNNIDQTLYPNDLFSVVPGLTDLMGGRYNYLINNANFTPVPPNISNVSDFWNGEVYVTANVTNATTVTVYFRYDSAAIFQSLQMWDDGQHEDGAAGDGKYGQSFPYNGLVAQYYVYAENANAGKFSPQRAEHEFYTANLNPPNPNVGDLVINEFLTGNVSAETDEAGQHEDWIELYNNTDNSISMTGLYLTDDASKPDKWLFPLGTTIPAKGFLIVWADEDQSQGPLHASFKLSGGGEFLMLSNGAGGVIDSLSFGQQFVDTTFGRYPNGTGNFSFMLRTFNATNSGPIVGVHEAWQDASLQIFPNPVSDILSIKSDQPLGLVRVSDTFGRIIAQTDAAGLNTTYLDMKRLPEGMYYARVGERAAKLIVLQR